MKSTSARPVHIIASTISAPASISPKLNHDVFGAAVARVEQHGAREEQHRHLEEDDEEDQHAHAVHAEDAVEPHGGQQVHGLPARQHEQHRGDGADEQRDDRRDGVHLDQALGAEVDAAAGCRAGPERRRGLAARIGALVRWSSGALLTWRRRPARPRR